MNAILDAALAHWSYVAPLLTPATNEDEYHALVESLDAILDAGGADENHQMAGLASMVGELVAAWETKHYPMPSEMSATETLRFLIEQHDLRQSDLPEIGNQAKVSEVLSGKRKVNARQAKALANRFGVEVGMFL